MKAQTAGKCFFPSPFNWIEIPNKSYSIAKYPITNAQFANFIKADGYQQQKWWTHAGWQRRTKESWIEPRFWRNNAWNKTEQPVIGISWYEAIAFCLWLSDVTGETITLPTEDQWQYAAQGDDGRTYPWGNVWDCERCNNSVNPCNSITPMSVQQYEGPGDSPFGVVEMAGNIWEWCLTNHYEKTNDMHDDATYRTLRGGSWASSETVDFRCYTRGRGYTHHSSIGWGFRICRT